MLAHAPPLGTLVAVHLPYSMVIRKKILMISCRHNPRIFAPTPAHRWRKAVSGHMYPSQAALDLVTRLIVTKLFPLLLNGLNTLAHQG